MADLDVHDACPNSSTSLNGQTSHFRWLILSLAFTITLINYLDRSAISYAKSALQKEFYFNDAQFGFVAGAFGIGYMIMTVGGGILVDRYGAHKVWTTAAVLWSSCTACMGLAFNVPLLFMLRTLLGIAEGPHFPSLAKVVADWLPSTERGRATSIGLAAVPISATIGGPLLATLMTTVGWKVMFVILGAMGIAWAVVWFFVYKDYPEACKYVSRQELRLIRDGQPQEREMDLEKVRSHHLSKQKTSWRFILLDPSLMSNNFAFFSFGYLLFFAQLWLPGYLEETYHLHLKEVGVFVIAPWLTAAILMPLAGWLSDWLWIKTGSCRIARTHLIWSCQLLSALCFVPVIFTHSLEVSIVMISLGIGIGLMPNGAFYALNCDLAKDRAGTSIGVMDCFFAAAGILAPVLTGLLSTHYGNFQAAFGLLAFLSITSAIAVLVFQHPDAPQHI